MVFTRIAVAVYERTRPFSGLAIILETIKQSDTILTAAAAAGAAEESLNYWWTLTPSPVGALCKPTYVTYTYKCVLIVLTGAFR